MDIELFVKERNEALLSLDKAKIDAYCEKYGANLPQDENAYWGGVHKAITGITGLTGADREKQLQSVKWLMVKGWEHYLSDITPDELMNIAFESAEEELTQ